MESNSRRVPHIVGIGGTTYPGSSTENALRALMGAIEVHGATIHIVTGSELEALPHYAPGRQARTPAQQHFVDSIRRADGLVVASPAYHAGISGLLKNALDLLEDLSRDPEPYLEGRPVGLIVTGSGWQALGATLMSLRTIAHALRGWPTPLGITLNTTTPVFGGDGMPIDPKVWQQMQAVASQVMSLAGLRVR